MQPDFPLERVIYQDSDILVVNKPSGLLTIPDGYDPSLGTLAAQLEDRFGRVWVVHRLDKDTSGLVLFARHADAHKELNRQFREREVQKSYFALVTPSPDWEIQTVTLPLIINAGRSHLTKVDTSHGKQAETSFTVLQRKLNSCLLTIQPKTGYRHQIRAHLYALGVGIFGDGLYKRPSLATHQSMAPRLMLQACSLAFTHPATNQTLSFLLSLDPDLQSFWERL